MRHITKPVQEKIIEIIKILYLFLLFMPVFPQPLFSFVSCYFMSFPLFTAWHTIIFKFYFRLILLKKTVKSLKLFFPKKTYLLFYLF